VPSVDLQNGQPDGKGLTKYCPARLGFSRFVRQRIRQPRVRDVSVQASGKVRSKLAARQVHPLALRARISRHVKLEVTLSG